MNLSRPAFWSRITVVSLLLWPVSLLFRALAGVRRKAYQTGLLSSWQSPVPVVIIGNITVGGAGKTPLVIALAELLTAQGYRVGIVARGYGGTITDAPVFVAEDSDVSVVGDEALLLAGRTSVPVVVGTRRVESVKKMLADSTVDCVLCDDGLQHYALRRDIEIAVVDSVYVFGNRFCLPAGPLREPVDRLSTVDMVVYSGGDRNKPGYSLTGSTLVSLDDENKAKPITAFSDATVHAVAGIASPENFFRFLQSHNIEVIPHGFGDHASYTKNDLCFGDELPVVMTEKDKVKCHGMGLPNCWYLPVTAVLDENIAQEFLTRVERVNSTGDNIAD